MSNLLRFGVSLDKELLRKFDERIKEKKYTNRSEAIRDLTRDQQSPHEKKKIVTKASFRV